MGKNRTFKNVYKITVFGKNTNGFSAKVLDKLILRLVIAIDNCYEQTNAHIECVETNGDYDAIAREYKENI